MIYILLISLAILSWITYSLKKDIFHPACLICFSFFFSVFCATLNIDTWGINLSSDIVQLILLGIISFILPCIFIHPNKDTKKEASGLSKIYVSKNIILVFLIAQSIFLLLFIVWMKNYLNGNFLDIFNSNIMTEFRFEKSFNQTINYPWYINQGIKFSKAFIYIITFLFINNNISNKRQKQKKQGKTLLVLSILMYSIQTMLTGGRSELIIYAIYATSLYFFIYGRLNKRTGTRIGVNTLKIIVLLAVVLYLFSASRTLVGRVSEDNPIYYISRYFGGSIPLFDDYLKNPIPKSQIIGKEIFFGINKFLNQIGILHEDYTIHLEFRSPNGIGLGNVYTAFRRMFQDFGVIGIIILSSIHGAIMALWYKKIYYARKIKFSTHLILYFMLLHTVVLMPFSDFFFSTVLSINYINIVLYLTTIIYILKKYNLKIR